MKYRVRVSFAGPIGSFRCGEEIEEGDLPDGVRDGWVECGMIEAVEGPKRGEVVEAAVKRRPTPRKRK